jgi:hypothetical protein
MCSVSPLTIHKIGVFPLTQSSALDKMFHAAPPGTFLQISSKRPGRARESGGKAYVHPLFALPSERRCDFAQIVQTAVESGDESVYTTLAAFNPSVHAFPTREQPYSFTVGRCAHLLGMYIDLDIGRSEGDAKDASQLVSPKDALEGTIRLIEEGAIPLPTMTAESGRGRYLIYIFAEALPRSLEVRRRMQAVHAELCKRLSGFSPDPSSGNTVQPFKVPGSPSIIGPVRYEILEQGIIAAPLYSLEAMEEVLDVAREQSSPADAQPNRSSSRGRGISRSSSQHVAPLRQRMHELWRLVPLRSRWTGYRHWLLLAFAEAARRWFCAGHPIEDGERLAFDETLRFNQSLPDPEDEAVVRSTILRSRLRPRPQKNETIVRNLDVSVEETLRAGLKSLAHPDIARRRLEAKQERRYEKRSRRCEIDDRLLSGEGVSSIARSVGVSRETIYRRKRKLPVV